MPDTEEATGGTAPTAPVQVITATRNLKSQPFNPGDDPTAQVKRGTTGSKESSANSDISRLRNPSTRKMHSSFMAGRKYDYEKLRKKLNDYFKPKKNKHHARYVFLKMRPAHGETTNAYAARLREKANDCEFEANCDERILEHLIQTTQNRSLIQKAINKKWD